MYEDLLTDSVMDTEILSIVRKYDYIHENSISYVNVLITSFCFEG